MSYIGLQENYNRIRSLIQMAKSDGFVNLAELTYIIFVAQKLGISQSELNELAKEEDNFSAPFSEQDRQEFLYELIKVMYVDGIVDDIELVHCKELATKLQLDEEAIANLFKQIQSNSNKLMEKTDFDRFFS